MELKEIREIRLFLEQLAFKAGELIQQRVRKRGQYLTKSNSADLVTQTDKDVESLVASELRLRFPHVLFMGEESYRDGEHLTKAPTFVVDPIDGTTNFVHGLPIYCISLGLSIDRRPVAGVVYNPATKDIFSADPSGVWRNGFTLDSCRGRNSPPHSKSHGITEDTHSDVSTRSDSDGNVQSSTDGTTSTSSPTNPTNSLPDELKDALLIVDWGIYRDGDELEMRQRTFNNLIRSHATGGAAVHGLRSLGSAALSLCSVAAGEAEAWWEAGGWPWDVCAGWAILKAAGGVVVDTMPGNWRPEMDGRRFFAIRGDGCVDKDEEGFSAGQRSFIQKVWEQVEGTTQLGV